MTKKFLALLLALSLVFALAACRDNEPVDETTSDPFADVDASVTSTDGQTVDGTLPSGEETTDTSGGSAQDSSNAGTQNVSGGSQSSSQGGSQGGSAASVKPSTKAEIVAYFNTAINDVKPNAKSIKREYSTNYRNGNITGVPGLVDSLVGGIDDFVSDQLANNSAGAATFTSAADKNANFPVENETWSSKLGVNDVASATCTESNGVYTITITTVKDNASSNVQRGSGHAPKAFSVVRPSVINDQFASGVLAGVARLFSIGTAQMEYPSSTVRITVNARTGKVMTAYYDAKWTILLPLGDSTVVLPLGTRSAYTISY